MEHTNLILRIAALDPAFSGTPQEFVDHFVERAEILSPSGFFNVIIADVAPNSNEGLLLLHGTKVYVWSTTESKYIPADITDSLYAPSIPDVLTGKWVLISEAGVWRWIKSSEFMVWLGGGLGVIPIGPSGTILSSLATVDWRTPANALPDGTVPVGKLQATTADVNKSPKVEADGKVSWQAQPTLAASIKFTADVDFYDIPAVGTALPIPRPASTQLLRIVLRKVADDPGNTDYPIGEEIDVESLGTVTGASNYSVIFTVSHAPSTWFVIRSPTTGGSGFDRIALPNRNLNSPQWLYITEDSPPKWKIKAYWF